MWPRRIMALTVATALLSGCGGNDDEATADSTTTTASASTSTTTGETTTTAAEPLGDELPDGTHFGYITELSINDTTATGQFDLAQLFTGDEAVAGAAEDGEEPPGDFYIRNVNPKLRPIEVDPDAEVTDIDYDACCDPVATNIAAFAADLEPPTPVMLTVAGDIVTVVEELYFP